MMVDFSKWVEAWNTYSPSHKITPGSPAYICNGIGMTLAMVAAVLALAVTVYAYATGEDIEHGKTSHIIMCMFSLAIVGVILMFMSEQLPSHSTSSTKPPTLSQQIGRTWNLDALDDCKRTGGENDFPVFGWLNDGEDLPDSRLKDGNWDCVASTDEYTQHVLVHIKGDKVGLYDAQGKALKPVGRK